MINHKYRMYLTNLAIKFQKEAEIHRVSDDNIAEFALKMAALCYEELAKMNKVNLNVNNLSKD